MMMNVVKTLPPPMTGNGNYSTYHNGDDWGMVCYCLNDISELPMKNADVP